MKHLKLFESFREEDIHAICEEYGIEDYTINEDGSIDVEGEVDLCSERLNKLPLKFRNVSDDFYCSNNQLTSLEGCPKSVSGAFDCGKNPLTSLEGSPKSVGNDFYCNDNYLTSLKGCPELIGGDFNCQYNNIVTFENLPLSIGGDFYCQYNNIVTFENLPLSIGGDFYCSNNPIWEIWDLFGDYSKIEFLNDCDAIREPDENSEDPIIVLDRFNFFLEEIGKKPIKSVKGYKCI